MASVVSLVTQERQHPVYGYSWTRASWRKCQSGLVSEEDSALPWKLRGEYISGGISTFEDRVGSRMGGGKETGLPGGLGFKQLEGRGDEVMGPANQEIELFQFETSLENGQLVEDLICITEIRLGNSSEA